MNLLTLYQGFLSVVLILVSVSTIATAAPVPEIIVTDYTLQSKKRVSRTEFEFVYSITVENTASSSFSDIEGKVSVNSGVYSLVDQNLYIPSIDPFESVSNVGHFTILVDRRYEFDPNALVFSFLTREPKTLFSKNQKLVGDPDKPSINSIENVFNLEGASEVIQDFDYSEGYVIRTRLNVVIGKSATVGNINDLLENKNAKIISSNEGVNEVLISFPDPGTMSGLKNLKSDIEKNSWIDHVYYDRPVAAPQVLPKDYQYQIDPPQDLEKIDHHLAVKSHGMWNIREKLSESDQDLHYVIIDHFGNGEPESGDSGNSISTIAKESFIYDNDPHESGHGYHVLGITLGSFGDIGSSSDKSLVTGIYPNELPITIIDVRHPLMTVTLYEKYSLAVISDLVQKGHRVVLNTSIGLCLAPRTDCPGNTLPIVQNIINNESHWTRIMRLLISRHPSISENLVHVTSAGNEGLNQNIGFHYATNNSSFAFSATEFPNVLVVENRMNSESTLKSGAQPKCLHPSSTEAVDASNLGPLNNGISAIGTDVYSFDCGIGASSKNPIDCISSVTSLVGTSMASPQVAGAALAVWAAKPDNSAVHVVNTLISNAQSLPDDSQCVDRKPAPVLDVYNSVLSLDTENDASRRLALLDVSNETWDGVDSEIYPDGSFGLGDLRRFVSEYVSRSQSGTNNKNFDYSRFDLNADGKTGEYQVAAPEKYYSFDLNANGVIEDSVSQNIEGFPISFIESNVTDAQILCYYAYSDLLSPLTADEEVERTIALLPILDRCGVDLVSIDIELKTSSIWNTPTTMTLSYNPGSLFQSGRFWPFNWYGEGSCGSEQGGWFAGVWSDQVESGAWFMPVTKVVNHPAPVGANRVPCSSFFAVKDGKVWFNATARRWSISGFSTSDREYHVRYFSDPQYSSGADPKKARTDTGNLSLGTVNSVPFGSYSEQQSISQPDVEFQFNFEPL